jgi:hypothetical protein
MIPLEVSLDAAERAGFVFLRGVSFGGVCMRRRQYGGGAGRIDLYFRHVLPIRAQAPEAQVRGPMEPKGRVKAPLTGIMSRFCHR